MTAGSGVMTLRAGVIDAEAAAVRVGENADARTGGGAPDSRERSGAGSVSEALGELADEALIDRMRDGEVGAGEVLVRRYYDPLTRYLQRLAGAQLAEELHQQTWLSVLDNLEKFNAASAGGGFKAWLFRI